MDFMELYGNRGFFNNPDNWDKSVDSNGLVQNRTNPDLLEELEQMVRDFEFNCFDYFDQEVDKPDIEYIRWLWNNMNKLQRVDIGINTDRMVQLFRKYQV